MKKKEIKSKNGDVITLLVPLFVYHLLGIVVGLGIIALGVMVAVGA